MSLDTRENCHDDQTLCSLCKNTEVRKLQCKHALCPECIEPFLLSPLGFACPVCSAFVPPGDVPSKPDLILKNCKACRRSNDIQKSATRCKDCHEPLCESCTKYHARNRASQNHATIPLQDLGSLLSVTVKENEKCQKHRIDVKIYCQDHGGLCCITCWDEDHRECKTYNTGIMKSHKIDRLIKKIKKQKADICGVIEQEKNNVKDLELQIKKFTEEIERITNSVIVQILSMKDDHIKYLKKVQNDCKTDFQKILEGHICRDILYDYYLNTLNSVKELGSDTDRFLSCLKIETQICEMLKEAVPQLEITVDMRVCKVIEEMKTMKKLFSLDVSYRNLLINPTDRNCKITQKRTIFLKSDVLVSGAAFLPGGHLLLADKTSNHLLLADHESGNLIKTIEKHEKPHSLQFFEGYVYVTFPQKKMVQVLSQDDLKVERTISIKQTCRAMQSPRKKWLCPVKNL